MAEKPERMTEDQLVARVQTEFEQSLGAPGGMIAEERALALAYYLSKPFGDEIEGESEFVTADVADVVDGIMPNLLRIFTTSDNLVSFDPVGEDDVEQAKQETDYVSYIFFKKNPSFVTLYTWFFDALVQKNGIVKAYYDESKDVGQETYKGLTKEELGELDSDPALTIDSADSRKEKIRADDGVEVEVEVHDVVFKRVSTTGRARVINVPPENYRISSDARSLLPHDARMVGEERDMTRSELILMGYDKKVIYELPGTGLLVDSGEEASRRDKSEERNEGDPDKSQEIIKVRECYLKVDFDNDGIAELRHIITGDNVKLTNEIADRQPYHVISPQPLPHKHFGRASAEKVTDIQRLNSVLIRQILNNLYHTNRPGHAVWEDAIGENTLDDLLTVRAGRVVRFGRPVTDSHAPIVIPFTAGDTFPMVQYFDKAKRERTGVSVDTQGLNAEALKNIQNSVLAQAMDIGRMKIDAVARIFAETGIKSVFLHLHEILLKHQDKEQVVKIHGSWTPISPSAWRTRTDMTVNIGLGLGSREQNLVHLESIFGKQKDIVTNDGWDGLVTPMNVYNTLAAIVRNANLKTPEMFFTPKQKIASKPGENEQLQQQEQAIQARQQQLDAERQQLNAGKLHLQAQRDVLKAQAERQKLALEKGELDLEERKRLDDLLIALENIGVDLTELDLKYPVAVPGSKVAE